MANYTGDLFKVHLLNKKIDFGADSFKIILMTTGYVFNRTTHRKYADVSASEIATGNGYTVNTKTLAGVAVAEDNVNHKATVTWNNPAWTASGGSIGPCAGALIFDDTHADDPIVMYIPFTTDQTQADGGTFTIASVEYDQVDTATAI